MKLLDTIGRLFTLPPSFPPMTGERLQRFRLMGLPNSVLRKMVPTTSHYSKRDLVDKIMNKKNG